MKENHVEVLEYDGIYDALEKLASEKTKIAYDENKCNEGLFELFREAAPVHKESIAESIKAQKNTTQMEGMRASNIRDCAAIMKYFGWLENEVNINPDSGLTEYDGARKVDSLREEGELFMGPSFDTISSSGPNGAVIHYKP